jgi:hypothetical protein
MYKAWILFTVLSVIFFLVCLSFFLFQNSKILEYFWEEALLIISLGNLFIAWVFYRKHKDEFLTRKHRKC